MLDVVVPVLGHPYEALPFAGVGLVCGGCLFGVDLGIGLDPLAGVPIGNLEVLVAVERRHDVHAQDLVVGLLVFIHENAEVDVDGTALAPDRLAAILFHQRVLVIVEHDARRLIAVVLLLGAHDEEDVDVLKRLGLRVPRVRPGEEVTVDRELRADVFADLGVSVGGVLLLFVLELEPAFELSEGVVDGQHQSFLQ
ncbi:hypothetical protein D9M72_538540 [compost metagenome]